jgi:hypothetical protein
MCHYKVAEICLNGHLITDAADDYPEKREKFCSKCGEATITQCPSCKTNIRGYYEIPGYIGVSDYSAPSYCYNCGNAFPWTISKIDSAVELVQLGGVLTDSELSTFKNDLVELTKESPKVQVASYRFKRVMGKIGGNLGNAVKDIIVDVISESAKKAIWG